MRPQEILKTLQPQKGDSIAALVSDPRNASQDKAVSLERAILLMAEGYLGEFPGMFGNVRCFFIR